MEPATEPTTRELPSPLKRSRLLFEAMRTGDIPRLTVRRCPECSRPVRGKGDQPVPWHMGPSRWWHRALRLVPSECRGTGLAATEG